MRRPPRNPKTVRDDDDAFRWALRQYGERNGAVVPGDDEAWCLRATTGLSLLGLRQPSARTQVRCPRCGRRMLVCEVHCVGGEFISWAMPPHKKPPAKKARPRRRERRGRVV